MGHGGLSGTEVGFAYNSLKPTIAFFISCGTGCSCCNHEDHLTGPFRSLQRAKEMVESYRASKRLASQYAPNGVYEIGWSKGELVPDGRIICDDRVFAGFIDDPDFDGWIGNIDTGFYPDSYKLDELPNNYVDPEAKDGT